MPGFPHATVALRLFALPPVMAADGALVLQQHLRIDFAFLQDDRSALDSHQQHLAAAIAESAMNRPNLVSVDRLQRCFGQPCKQACRCREKT